MSSLHPRAAWRTAGLSIATLLLLIFILYQQTILYLSGKWNQLEMGEYGHGYLVLAISAYLIFYNRSKLMALMPCPEYRAMLAVVSASILWMVASLVDVQMLQATALLLLLLSIVWALLGSRVAQILLFPIVYLVFAIPVWFPLSPLLQEMTADAVFWIIRVMEIPALRIENMIVLPAGKLSIEEACSGLRYFLAALTLSTFYAYLNYATFSARLLVVMVFAGAAILLNILRVLIIVYLGYKTDMQHPLVHDHLTLGWYLFGGLVMILLVTDAVLQRVYPQTLNGVLDTDVHEPVSCNKSKSAFTAFVLGIVLTISAGPLLILWISEQQQSDSYPVQVKLPPAAGGWSYMAANEDGWTPQYQGAIAHRMAYHDINNHEIQLYLGIYPRQRQGEELINDLNKISDNKIWRIRYQKANLYNIDGIQVLEQLLEKNDGSQRLVWYWYRVAGQNTVNKYQAKALQVLGLLNGMRQASLVAITSSLDGSPEDTRKILGQFTKEMGASIDRVIDAKM